MLAPLGHGPAAIDLVLWPVVTGIFALLVYKAVSNQAGIARAQDRIKMHLLEIRLWRNDLRVVFTAVAKILWNNGVYLGHNLLPMVVMFAPTLLLLTQLVANYAKAPSPVGTVELLSAQLAPGATVSARDVRLELPAGVALDAPPVRTPDGELFWRLRAEQAGDHALTLVAGDERLVKTWAVGGQSRKVPVLRTQSLETLLYPGEPAIDAGSAFYEVRLAYPDRELAWLWDGEEGVLGWFLAVSLVAGFALKDLFGVKL